MVMVQVVQKKGYTCSSNRFDLTYSMVDYVLSAFLMLFYNRTFLIYVGYHCPTLHHVLRPTWLREPKKIAKE